MAPASLKETYTYDESGNRVTFANANGTTYYVYDASGNTLAIYTGATPTLTEVPVYGSSRLGTYFVTGAYCVYEIRDNVGSVRVAFTDTKTPANQANIYNYTDYYPYGLPAQSAGTGYRYAYQGAYAESDGATGYDNFKLRMYDARIGRWLSVDPLGQDASPYEGMGNDPVSGIDPTGGGHFDANGNYIADASDNTTYNPGSDVYIYNKVLNQKIDYTWTGSQWVAENTLSTAQASNMYWSYTDAGQNPFQGAYKTQLDDFANSQAGIQSVYQRDAKQLNVAKATILVTVAVTSPMGEAAAFYKGGEAGTTVFRTMTEESAERFLTSGKMPAGTETFVSFSEGYASKYTGVLFKIKLAPGTISQLEEIGVRNLADAHPMPDLPIVQSGWKAVNAFFKMEGGNLNIGLGNGNALDIFNSNIRSFKTIP